MSELVQALSRLAGNRHSDGTSSIVSHEDRTTIINGCHHLLLAARQAPADISVGTIVPPHCSGYSFVFEPGVLYVKKDGSGYIVVNEDDFVLEDDRCEGPDGPEGSVHWIAHMDASEIVALRDFLNGAPAERVMGHPYDPADGQCKVCGRGAGYLAHSLPAPHVVPGDDWTVDDTDTARVILNYLGIGDDASREPGADRRRDKVAQIIRARIDASQPAPVDHVRGAVSIPKQAVIDALAEFQRSQKVNPEYDLIDHLQNAMAQVWPAPAEHVVAVIEAAERLANAADEMANAANMGTCDEAIEQVREAIAAYRLIGGGA